jgi:pyruvate dehydrogenase complex dehydrogenase (E1) component
VRGHHPYANTIPVERQAVFPGSREIQRRIKSIVRWNAMAMVVRANRRQSGIGGHISTYASCATLFEVGFNHFFRGHPDDHPGDIVYFQGHASPGVYARAYLEGRLDERQPENFRRELLPEGGLPSYPHPWLMPDFKDFFGRYPELEAMVRHLTDEQLWKLRRGGHDPQKVYAACHAAVRNEGTPTVILAKTIKGYGPGEAGEGRNVTHQQKKLDEEGDELKVGDTIVRIDTEAAGGEAQVPAGKETPDEKEAPAPREKPGETE